jgi:hypothetical protein
MGSPGWPSHRGAPEEAKAAALRLLISAGLTHTEAALLLVHVEVAARDSNCCPFSEIALDTASQVRSDVRAQL